MSEFKAMLTSYMMSTGISRRFLNAPRRPRSGFARALPAAFGVLVCDIRARFLGRRASFVAVTSTVLVMVWLVGDGRSQERTRPLYCG